MPSRVTEIRRGPRGSKRRRIFVDGDEWLTLPAEVVRDIGLREDAQVDLGDLERRIVASLPVQAWERALRLLNVRERGSGELSGRLTDDGYPPEIAHGAVERARELGFLDDRRFADSLVRGLVRGKGYGRRRVAAALSAKGVDPELAEELLAGSCGGDEERERAEALAARFVARCPDPRRLASRLVARGFAPGLSLDVARAVCTASDLREDDS
jgi:regulatory protein